MNAKELKPGELFTVHGDREAEVFRMIRPAIASCCVQSQATKRERIRTHDGGVHEFNKHRHAPGYISAMTSVVPVGIR